LYNKEAKTEEAKVTEPVINSEEVKILDTPKPSTKLGGKEAM
jgi:hypothetical protein